MRKPGYIDQGTKWPRMSKSPSTGPYINEAKFSKSCSSSFAVGLHGPTSESILVSALLEL